MNFQFKILFEVCLRHQYFNDAPFAGIAIVPNGNTLDLLRRFGLVFKASESGFLVGYDTFFAGTERSREQLLREDIVLSFRMELVDHKLYNYTGQLPKNIFDTTFRFANEKGTDGSENGWLHQGPYVSEKDLVEADQLSEVHFAKPFGEIQMTLGQGMGEQFEIRFAAKSTFWKYVLVSEHLGDLNNPAILNKETKQAFEGPLSLSLPRKKKDALAFISKEPILITKTVNRSFELVENYEPGNGRHKTVIQVLPNPDINLISGIPGEGKVGSGNEISFILL